MSGEIVDEVEFEAEAHDSPTPQEAYREIDAREAVALLPAIINDGRWEQLEQVGWALIGWSRAKRGGRFDDE